MKLEYKVKKEDCFQTVLEILKCKFAISDRLLIKLKKNQKIFLNEMPVIISTKINIEDVVSVDISFEEDNSNILSTEMKLDIIYEDEAYIVINKPNGIPVHPSMDHYTDSLSNGLKYYLDSVNLKRKIRPVNRIDKNTSGIVIFAKNEYIQESLIRQMKENKFHKEYIAVCEGIFNEKSSIINANISRKENSIIERCITIQGGDTAITHYEVIKHNPKLNYSILKCILKTGRTHQIRVHMSYIDHPLLGDTLYGNESKLIDRQALHAYKVSFVHPISKQVVDYTAPIPEDILNLINF